MIAWLAQEIVLPLWAFIVALLLPAAFFSRLAKEAVKKRLGAIETSTDG
jgi:hypothetical protein